MSDTDLAFRATLDGSGFASGLGGMQSSLSGFTSSLGGATSGIGGLAGSLGMVASPAGLATAGIMALGGALYSSVQAAAAFETSMSGVAKTTGLAGPELSALGDQLLTMSTNMPVAASSLAEIAQVAGSLGVAKGEIAGFTETASQMSVAFDMPAEAAATSAAKILTAFQMDIDSSSMESLGNVVNTMGDNFAATESEVLDFTNRASYLNTTFGMSIPQVAAWGTALISAGMSSETAATGIKSLMAMSMDPKKFEDFAAAAGISAEELKQSLNEDVMGTYAQVAEKIAGSTDAVEKFQTVSKLAGSEGMTTLLKMAGAGDNLKSALAKANGEWENGSSMMKTFEQNSSTLNSEWTMFTNTITSASTGLGNELLPTLTSMVSFATDFVKVGMKVGEVLDEWGVDEALGKLWDLTPIGMLQDSEVVGGWWEDTKKWAGIGEEIGDETAKGIENSDLPTAPGDALSSPEALAAVGESAKDLAKKVSEEMIPGIMSGMKDLDILAMINSQSDPDEEKTVREFEYLGQKIRMALRNGSYSIFADDTLMGQGTWDDKNYETLDPLAAFEAATGLPAPEEGTAAYFRLVGNAAEAERVEMLAELKSSATAGEQSWIFGAEEAIKSKMEALGESVVNAMEDGIVTEAERSEMLGLSKELNVLSSQFPAEFEKVGGDAGRKLIDGVLSNDIPGAMAQVGTEAGKSFAEALGLQLEGIEFDWSKLLSPVSTSEIGEGWADFSENMFQPELIDAANQALDLWNTGLDENRRLAASNIPIILQLAEVNGWLFTETQMDAIDDYNMGLSDTETLLEALAAKTEKLSVATEKFADDVEDAEACCGGLLSAFGAWQESNPQLFYASFKGPSYGPMYEDYITAKWSDQAVNNVKIGSEAYERMIQIRDRFFDSNTDYDDAATRQQIREDLAWIASYDPQFAEAYRLQDLSEGVSDTAAKVDILKEGIFETSDAIDRLNSNDITIKTRIDGSGRQMQSQMDQPVQQQRASTLSQPQQASATQVAALTRAMTQLNSSQTRLLSTTQSMSRNLFAAINTASADVQAAMAPNITDPVCENINSAAASINEAIGAAAAAIIAALDCGSGGGGGGTGLDGIGTPYYGNLFPINEPGLFTEGGYAGRATYAIVGDSPGGEYMVPAGRVGEFVAAYMNSGKHSGGDWNLSMSTSRVEIPDMSYVQSHISEAISSMSIPAIRIPVEIDTGEIVEAVLTALNAVSSDVRVRRGRR